jgi:processive 1,2-diacylglycerol beta-glucosyltransferase
VRRFLVLSASAGAGHLRAAEAVEAALKEACPDATVKNVDALTLTPPPFRRLYGKGYLDLVNRAPEIVGIIYDRTNRTPKHPAGDQLRLGVERLNTRPLKEFVRDFEPDLICHTHFLPAEILAHEAGKGRLCVPQVVVVTDFDVHRFWLTKLAARYYVAREECRVHLGRLGVDTERIRVSGIPIHPVFSRVPGRGVLGQKHGVKGTLPLLLVMCGGFGVGPMEALLGDLVSFVKDAEIVVVAGKNEALRKRLEKAVRSAPVPTRVIGFTTEIHEWMALADLAVTKPGGLTTSEALAMGLPLVIANAIPGQETRNATMLYEAGAAISGENPATLGYRVGTLLKSPGRLKAMGEAARHLARPRAAQEVVDDLLTLASGEKKGLATRSPGA